jgi:hypothetical protein
MLLNFYKWCIRPPLTSYLFRLETELFLANLLFSSFILPPSPPRKELRPSFTETDQQLQWLHLHTHKINCELEKEILGSQVLMMYNAVQNFT